ncbi:phosphoenolpyruvate--protein phosphotransferase [Agrobacterium sp. SOY23]|uniref:phosphoenolpyruvate--protein phosphotransferase n=1 Tax=Agrobacterium sp. SOY23 TaxID=3014555 RepID=UPI0022AF754B|nr:phosphoenolpyruvate--protein phosphotransferase [Agrobacterium sp. SOY23]MCZ4433251.1 phosphoenolpyruvate--protein phosphotransferase [Agrobacterium sp. SOY23]
MERSTIVRVHEGLHARPATRFVKLAKSFESDVEITKSTKSASAKSSVKLMLLAVKENDTVTLRADGADAEAALDALVAFLADPQSGLGEEGIPSSLAADEEPGRIQVNAPVEQGGIRGIAASEGVALAPAFLYFPEAFSPTHRRLQDNEIPLEIATFRQAVTTVQTSMEAELARDSLSETDRSIITALCEIAGDPAINDEIVDAISQGYNAMDAVLSVTEGTAAAFGRVSDVYLNARADDVKAIARQICLALTGKRDVGLHEIDHPSIVVADDIGAWDLARAPLKLVKGIVCAHGGATSHIAIIARAHGIPAVLGLGSAVEDLAKARDIALDGGTGQIIADPSEAIRATFEIRIADSAEEEKRLRLFKDITPKRADGTTIEVAANVGSLEEIEIAREAGAMGIGLFRTELLFMKHGGLPTEEAQYEVYAEAARVFSPDPVIIRTLDIGGDKPVAGIAFPVEQNPFLGWRGVRMCLDRPDIFKPQLKALLRAAVHGNLKVMLPMVSTLHEVRRTRVLIEECAQELSDAGVAFQKFALGVMIETPAAVMIAPALAKEVDFFSIGTNDLTQYVMAADRMNPQVAELNEVNNPAILAAIEMTARAGIEAGIMVGMCGEAAARPDLIPTFLKMGLTELSMSAASIPRAKKCIMDALGISKT